MTGSPAYHVLTKVGDAQREVERALHELGSADATGLHRHFFVSRANQTVVLTESPDSPIARMLRSQPGWLEPQEGAAAT